MNKHEEIYVVIPRSCKEIAINAGTHKEDFYMFSFKFLESEMQQERTVVVESCDGEVQALTDKYESDETANTYLFEFNNVGEMSEHMLVHVCFDGHSIIITING